jgi:hypothetical protein
MTNRIVNLPARAPELGRIRSGWKDPDQRADRQMQPLRNWRLTSKNKDTLHLAAGLYGGIPREWNDPAHPGEWELFTESDRLDILLPNDPLFTAYEAWGSGGNKRRCDGERCIVPMDGPDGGGLTEVECWCAEKGIIPGEHKDACGVTVRLKVVIPELPGFGIWMLTSGSIFAAMELPAQVDMIQAATGALPGTLIPCQLILDYRTKKNAWEKFERKYSVPSLDVNESVKHLQRQMELAQGHHPTALGPGSRAAALQTQRVESAVTAQSQSGFDDGAAATAGGIENVWPEGAPPYDPPAEGWTLDQLKEIATKHGVTYLAKVRMSDLAKDLKAEDLIA